MCELDGLLRPKVSENKDDIGRNMIAELSRFMRLEDITDLAGVRLTGSAQKSESLS